jgi:hypothetical protein
MVRYIHIFHRTQPIKLGLLLVISHSFFSLVDAAVPIRYCIYVQPTVRTGENVLCK